MLSDLSWKKPARVPKRRFPMVEQQYCKDKDSPSRSTRAILVEVMDPNDPELSWDVKNSDVYKALRDLDLSYPERKSFGALSAGSNFVLFEVTGRNDPVFLVGEPTKLAHFVIDVESLEQKLKVIHQIAGSGMCKCSDPEEVTSHTVKAALVHDIPMGSSASDAETMLAPAVTTRTAPTTNP